MKKLTVEEMLAQAGVKEYVLDDNEAGRSNLIAQYGNFWEIWKGIVINPQPFILRGKTVTKNDGKLYCLRPAFVTGMVFVIQQTSRRAWTRGRIIQMFRRGTSTLTKLIVRDGQIRYRNFGQSLRMFTRDRPDVLRWALRLMQEGKISYLKRELEKMVSEEEPDKATA